MKEIEAEVFDVIAEVAETDDFRAQPNLDLFDEGMLDSMRAMLLIVELESHFDLSLPPSEMDRDEWNTATKIVARIQEKIDEKA